MNCELLLNQRKTKSFSHFSALFAAVLASLACVSAPAFAATANTNITNTASMVSMCQLSVSQNINFGVYDPLVTHRTSKPAAQGQIDLKCTPGSYDVHISNGANTAVAWYSAVLQGNGQYRHNHNCSRNMRAASGDLIRYAIGTDPTGTSANNLPIGVLTSNTTPVGNTSGNCVTGVGISMNSFRRAVINSPETHSITVYGRIVDDTNSAARAGSYSDSIVVSVTF